MSQRPTLHIKFQGSCGNKQNSFELFVKSFCELYSRKVFYIVQHLQIYTALFSRGTGLLSNIIHDKLVPCQLHSPANTPFDHSENFQLPIYSCTKGMVTVSILVSTLNCEPTVSTWNSNGKNRSIK